jgi:hypothetical protein
MPETGPARFFQVTSTSDPRLQSIVQRATRTVHLAAEKAAAHHSSPQTFPMPADRNSLEAVFLAGLKQKSPDLQQRTLSRMLPRVHAPIAIRQARYAELAVIDLRLSVSVAEQVAHIALPSSPNFSADELMYLVLNLGAEFSGPVEMIHAVPD